MASGVEESTTVNDRTNNNEAEVMAIKKKKEQAKKSELLREVHKLSVQIQTMEREKSTQIFSKRSDFYKDYQGLKEGEDKMGEERKTEKIRLQQQLEKINHMIRRFQKELKDLKATPEFVERLKTIMDDIEGTITSFKESQRKKYEELMKVEQTLSLEIQQMEKKFDDWSQKQQVTAVPSITKPIANSRDVTKDLPPEVAAFDKFVHQSGGHRGGWDEYDHQTFLRYRRMYKGRIVFLDHVKPYLPTKLESEIRDHESWYQEYLFLNENKKYAIIKWRETKQEEKEDIVGRAQEEDGSEEDEDEQKKRLQEVIAQERSERFKQINAWKVQKELEKAMKEERKIKDELEKAKKRETDKKRQLEMKRQVEEYQTQKKLEEEILQQIQENQKRNEDERKKITAVKEIVRFRTRDAQKLTEKKVQEREKEEAKKQREQRLAALKSQVQVSADRDPDRLLKPTSVWKERLKKSSKSKPSGGGQVFVMPHRAVPAWRKS